MELRTPLCELLGIDLPILCAGMGFLAGPELAAAVSGAGGLGVLGNGSAGPEFVRHQVARTRELTERPIGVNLIVQADEPGDADYLCEQIRLAAECGANHIVLFWGEAAPFVASVRESGQGKVLIQVGSVPEAEAAAEAGVDAIIAQGVEAGGHVRGTESVWDLLPATIAAVAPIPVLASGGIGNGEGLARALSLGAQGVSLGTRFVASEEADAHPEYKRRIVAAKAAETVYTQLFDRGWPDAPHRVLRNRVFDEWEEAGSPATGARPGEGEPIGRQARPGEEPRDWIRYSVGSALASFDGDVEDAPLWAGESVEVVDDIRSAGEIVRSLAAEAEAIFSAAG
jgi:nitronate monooxygenase